MGRLHTLRDDAATLLRRGAEAAMTTGHRHEWEVVAYTDGHIHATCACGHERLLTGTLLRGRSNALRGWTAPPHWNPHLKTDDAGA